MHQQLAVAQRVVAEGAGRLVRADVAVEEEELPAARAARTRRRRLTLPARSDFTSLPVQHQPGLQLLLDSKSKRARRLLGDDWTSGSARLAAWPRRPSGRGRSGPVTAAPGCR